MHVSDTKAEPDGFSSLSEALSLDLVDTRLEDARNIAMFYKPLKLVVGLTIYGSPAAG